jgi:hypothetical protein
VTAEAAPGMSQILTAPGIAGGGGG